MRAALEFVRCIDRRRSDEVHARRTSLQPLVAGNVIANAMKLRPIRNDLELERALKRIDELWGTKPGTADTVTMDAFISGEYQ